MNGFQVDKPSDISLGDLLHVLTPPLTITYKCTPHTENVSLLETPTPSKELNASQMIMPSTCSNKLYQIITFKYLEINFAI